MGHIKNLTDEEILTKYLERPSDRYFQALHSRYIHKVYSKAISLLKDEALAEDAVQEIFLKIFLNLSKFTFRSKFSTWVYSISYNYCIDLLRKQKKHQQLFISDGGDDLSNVEDIEVDDSALLEMELSRLERVLDEISLDDKTVLLMKYQDGMSIKDISEIMDKSESAVKMKIKRAKAKALLTHGKLYPSAMD